MVFSKPGLGTRKRWSGEGRQSPELDIRRIAKIFIHETKIYIFVTRIPRGVYVIFWGFFNNFIFPTSGRYLQTSAFSRICLLSRGVFNVLMLGTTATEKKQQQQQLL